MGRQKKNPPLPGHSDEPADTPTPVDRLRRWLLAATVALLVARPLFPGESASYAGDGLPVVMLWIAVAVCWMLGAIGRRRFPLRFGWTDAAVLLLIVLHTTAAVVAARSATPRPAINMLWEWIGLGLAYFLARQLIVTPREARSLAAVMIALAVGLSGYGLYQHFYELPQTRAQYYADPDAALRSAGLWLPPDSPQRERFENRLQSTEPIATFALTNSLAGYLVPWLVVAAGIAIAGSAGGDGGRPWLIRLAVICSAAPVAACLLLTKSRSGCVATAVGLVLVCLVCRPRKMHLGWKLPAAVVAMGMILVAIAVAVGLDREVLSEASKSLGYRVQYWQSTMRMIAAEPLVGCGPGNFQNAYTQYKLPEASEEVADPHNFLLEVWATAGTGAMLAMLAVLGCFAHAMFSRHYPRSHAPHYSHSRSHAPHGNATEGSDVPMRSMGTRTRSMGTRKEGPHVDGAWYVYAGGVFGFLLAVPLGQIAAAGPGPAATLLGLPLAAGSIALLHPWVKHGRLPPLLPAVAVAALLVNLLAAGGIGFPSVAGSLWLLLALGLSMADDASPRMLPRSAALAGLAAAIALAAACHQTAYSPVLRCQGFLRRAERQPAEAARHLADAAAADPLSAVPWQQLAAVTLAAWQQAPDAEKFRRFESHTATALRLAPNASTAWAAAGDWYRKAFAATTNEQHIRKAIGAYRRAVALYPKSNLYHAKLALALRAAGDQLGFRREADAALELDRLTPHEDRKLPETLREQLVADGRKTH